MTQLPDHHADITAIKSLIQHFFDAINASDTKALGTHFFPTATLTIIRQEPPRNPSSSYYPQYASLPVPKTQSSSTSSKDEKLEVVMRTTIEKFIALLDEGQKHREPGQGPVLHEAPDLERTEVKLDALLGSAWSPFSVTFDGVLHHYGVMCFTVGKGGGEWKIEGLTQSYRRTVGWPESKGSVL